MKTRDTLLNSILIVLLTVSAFLTGYITNDYTRKDSSRFSLLIQAYEVLSSHGLKPIPENPRLEYGMIHGMVQAYGDPFTSFYEPVQQELQTNALTGSFGGIGVTLEQDEQGNWLLYPFPVSPGYEAGLRDGDQLVQVDDMPVSTTTPADVIQAAVRGEVGTKVRITVIPAAGGGPVELTIRRAEISLPSVTWRLDDVEPRLGILKVNIIADSTAREIEKAVADLQSRGATAFVLDLRDNGGGLLNAGIEISRLFLAEGTIIEQQYREQAVDSFRVEKPGPLSGLPLVVLVNGNTASASEIIAGAFQSNDRALLVGTQTYGKNTIQLVFNLDDGSSMHVTSANWWIPGIEFPVEGHGLVPDVTLPVDNPDPDLAIREAEKILFPIEN